MNNQLSLKIKKLQGKISKLKITRNSSLDNICEDYNKYFESKRIITKNI